MKNSRVKSPRAAFAVVATLFGALALTSPAAAFGGHGGGGGGHGGFGGGGFAHGGGFGGGGFAHGGGFRGGGFRGGGFHGGWGGWHGGWRGGWGGGWGGGYWGAPAYGWGYPSIGLFDDGFDDPYYGGAPSCFLQRRWVRTVHGLRRRLVTVCD
ncbi:MAG: hypothetical protein KGL46_09035 [Hyphomicrobiales bacterium]|nr:hypothetical protein [Hyphomicrobiales bacterium]